MLELATLRYINSLHDKISLKKKILAKNKVVLWTSFFLELLSTKHFLTKQTTVLLSTQILTLALSYKKRVNNRKSTANLTVHMVYDHFLQVVVHKITTDCWHLYISGQIFEIPADYLKEMSCCLYLVLKPIADQPLCSDSCHRFLLIHSVEISSFYVCINKKAYSFANKMLLS